MKKFILAALTLVPLFALAYPAKAGYSCSISASKLSQGDTAQVANSTDSPIYLTYVPNNDTGRRIQTVPAGSMVNIISNEKECSSDNFLWVRAEYNGVTGWAIESDDTGYYYLELVGESNANVIPEQSAQPDVNPADKQPVYSPPVQPATTAAEQPNWVLMGIFALAVGFASKVLEHFVGTWVNKNRSVAITITIAVVVLAALIAWMVTGSPLTLVAFALGGGSMLIPQRA